MSRTFRGAGFERRSCRACLLAVLLALAHGTPLCGQTGDETDELLADVDLQLAGVDRCLSQLDQVRIAAGPHLERVAAAVTEAMEILDAVDRRLAAAIGELPAGEPATKGLALKIARKRWRLRSRRCHVAVLRGEVATRAAEALPQGEPNREKYLADAAQTFRDLRVNYLHIPMASMGYVGEARALRLSGNVEQADQVLGPMLTRPKNQNDDTAMALYRAAIIEKLENALAANLATAVAHCDAQLKSRDFRDEPLWTARIRWVAAKACLADLRPAGTAGAGTRRELVDKATGLLRDEGVVQMATAYDRLALIEELDRLAGGGLMTRQERLAWADALSAAGHLTAADVYAKALATGGEPLSGDRLSRYATLLWQRGDLQGTAAACDLYLKTAPVDHAERGTVVSLRAVSLLKVFQGTDDKQATDAMTDRLLSALQAVVESPLPSAARRDALRQWVSIKSRRDGLDACAALVAEHGDLTPGDAYLLYAAAAGRWQALSARVAAGEVKDAVAAEEARAVASALQETEVAALSAKATALEARAALLRAQVLAGAPLRDARAALQVVTSHWQTLKSDAATAQPAAWLRVELMMDLGLVDAATQAVAELQAEGAGGPAGVSLRLADALSQRYDTVTDDRRGAIQTQVVSLCNQAMTAATRDEQSYVAVARQATEVLLRVGASADAEAIARRLLESPEVAKDKAISLDCALMLAEALELGGKANLAVQGLETLAKDHPKSVVVRLRLGRCRMALRQADRAAEAYREARGLSPQGSPDWCRATLGLAEGLDAGGHRQAAADILRVARALHPEFGEPELLAQLKRLTASFKDRTPD